MFAAPGVDFYKTLYIAICKIVLSKIFNSKASFHYKKKCNRYCNIGIKQQLKNCTLFAYSHKIKKIKTFQ